MLSVNKDLDENVRKKLNEVLREATKIVTNSVNLWQVRINTLLQDGHEEEADSILPTVIIMRIYNLIYVRYNSVICHLM